MIERAMDRFGLYPQHLAGDSAYGAALMVGWLVEERGVEPHVAVIDKSERKDGTFSHSDFFYDREDDIYICPDNKVLTTTGTLVNGGTTMLYRCEQSRLLGLPAESSMLSERTCSQSPSFDP